MKKRKQKNTHIVISGYYGFGSIGDEAILMSILSGIADACPDCHVTVLTNDKTTIPSIEGINIRPIFRFNILALLPVLFCADVFISGGGSLFQDKTSSRSLYYYCALIHLAKLCRTKVYIYANGIGPLSSHKICRKALNISDIVSVRDPDSLTLAKSIIKKSSAVTLSADPVFAYRFARNREHFLSCLCKLPEKQFFAVSLRQCANEKDIDITSLTTAVLYYKNQGLTPVFVSMQKSYDLDLCKKAARITGGAVADIRNIDELYYLLEKAEFSIGMRLHFLICSAIAGTPAVALSYDCKIDGCIKHLGYGEIIPAFDFSAKKLIRACDRVKQSFDRTFSEERCAYLKSLAINDKTQLAGLLNTAKTRKERRRKMEKFFADT